MRERVRFVETDLMGVVHHANYFRWFEVGRVEYLRQAGILLNDMMADGIVFPIRDVDCRYLAPARFDDVLLIEAVLSEVSRAKMLFSYRVLRESDGELLVTGHTCNVFTNPEGRLIRLPDRWYQLLRQS